MIRKEENMIIIVMMILALMAFTALITAYEEDK